MRAFLLLAAGWLVMAGTPAAAAPYLIDKSHAHVSFRVSHLGFSTVLGQFRKFEGAINFDPGNVEATQVRFVIDAASVETFWAARDKDIRSRRFLDVANHPTITFNLTSVKPTGAATADLTGNLTMLGVTRPIAMKGRLNRIGPSPFNRSITIAGFTVTGEIDRRAFGMNYAAPAIGAKVVFRIELEISPAR